MQVSFNGLYRITGKPENARGEGQTIHDLSNRRLESFLEDTKKSRNGKGSIYYDTFTQDLFIPVDDKKELEFEDKVELYNIDCVKIDKVARNSEYAEDIVEALTNIRLNEARKKLNMVI